MGSAGTSELGLAGTNDCARKHSRHTRLCLPFSALNSEHLPQITCQTEGTCDPTFPGQKTVLEEDGRATGTWWAEGKGFPVGSGVQDPCWRVEALRQGGPRSQASARPERSGRGTKNTEPRGRPPPPPSPLTAPHSLQWCFLLVMELKVSPQPLQPCFSLSRLVLEDPLLGSSYGKQMAAVSFSARWRGDCVIHRQCTRRAKAGCGQGNRVEAPSAMACPALLPRGRLLSHGVSC